MRRGTEVKAGTPLFTLEHGNEAQAGREAAERLREARARLDDLKKGRPPSEIAAIEAQQAQAALKLSETQLKRYETLAAEGTVPREKLDEARTAHERDKAKIQELVAQAETATMTMVMMTALAVTREYERGAMENLLATPVTPLEVMVGKIIPYIVVGCLQITLILLAARFLFNVPLAVFLLVAAAVALVRYRKTRD